MRIKLLFTTLIFCSSFFVFVLCANAQTTVVAGPSDSHTNPPAAASSVNQVLCSGGSISLKISSSSTASDINYQWYKLDSTGVKHLAQSNSSGTYAETAAAAGYYTYQLAVSNSNQCTSEISDPFKVYVLPALNPTIAGSNGTVCSNGTSTPTTTLTVSSVNTKYSYLYQWTLNGTDTPGATTATYTTMANATGSNTYGVKVSYALSPSCSGTASQVINVTPVPIKPAILAGR